MYTHKCVYIYIHTSCNYFKELHLKQYNTKKIKNRRMENEYMQIKQNESIKILVSDLIEFKIKAPIKTIIYQEDMTSNKFCTK